MRRIPRYHNPKQRSRAPHAPQASTTVTHCFLEMLPLCLNLNEPQTCLVCIFLYMLVYVEIRPLGTPKGSSSTHLTRAIFSQKRLRSLERDRLYPDVVIKRLIFHGVKHSGSVFCDAECTTYPFFPLLTYYF